MARCCREQLCLCKTHSHVCHRKHSIAHVILFYFQTKPCCEKLRCAPYKNFAKSNFLPSSTLLRSCTSIKIMQFPK